MIMDYIDYKELYEATFKYAKQLYDADSYDNETLEAIFPELKDSEGERIRKELIFYLRYQHSISENFEDIGKWIAWLEKQGEHANFRNKIQIGDKVTRNKDGVLVNLSQLNRVAKKDEKQGEHNKWKPSKDEMDALYGLSYITNKMDDKKDESITKLYQDLKREFFNGASYENMFPSSPVDSDINIEKQGKQQDVNIQINPEEYINDMGGNGCYLKNTVQKPADKVEPKKEDTSELTPFEAELFSMMSDAWQGYQLGEEVNIAEIVKEHSSELLERANKQNPAWSEEDELHIRELESLVKQVWATAERENDKDTIHKMSDLSFFLKTLKPQLKQEWSEEDKEQLDRALYMMEQLDMTKSWDDVYNWLKSLKDRVPLPPKQMWSEEDEKMLNRAIKLISPDNNHSDYAKYKLQIVEWIKSLRPQKQWKPSEEQMTALSNAGNSFRPFEEGHKVLWSLYNDLKKLREE